MKALWLLLAYLSCTLGFGWLALAMASHWQQVGAAQPLSRRTSQVLRGLGAAAVMGSLWICLGVDHASMAALVWVLLLAAAAVTVALGLAWCPRVLAGLVFWLRPQQTPPAPERPR